MRKRTFRICCLLSVKTRWLNTYGFIPFIYIAECHEFYMSFNKYRNTKVKMLTIVFCATGMMEDILLLRNSNY